MYNSGMQLIDPKPEQKQKDPVYPVTDPLLKQLDLSKEVIRALVLISESTSGTKFKMRSPNFPTE